MSTFLRLEAGEVVESDGERYVITHILSLDTVLCKHATTGKTISLNVEAISSVNKVPQSKNENAPDLDIIDDAQWKEAEHRYDVLHPLLIAPRRTLVMVNEAAALLGIHVATVYRRLRILECEEKVSALTPRKPNGGKGKSRLSDECEEIVQSVINDKYLNKQKLSVKKVHEDVKGRCRTAGIKSPGRNTISKRINAIPKVERDKHRLGNRVASENNSMFPGRFPGADWPLAVVQIDHTPLDIILVDDIYRLHAAKPNLTLAIDLFSRMVLGYYLTLDPVGSMSVGQCITHGILPKEKWLAKFNITTPWPCWGVMTKIHADNAGEFRGNMLKRACKEYGIDLEWRPVKTPHYGGHIESLLGTVLEELHTLPGTTFSNPTERGDYDSEGEAMITFSEFEEWLTKYFVGVYHLRKHSALGISPLEQYERGILGTEDIPGRGLPTRIVDEETLRLDLMPFERRTIQAYGVEIEGIHYYHEVLRRYKDTSLPDNPRRKPRFRFTRDPRKINPIYFYDPDLKQYFPIPYRDRTRPTMSVWDLRASKVRLKAQGVNKEDINEDSIFKAFSELKQLVDEAMRKTKAARRSNQRRVNQSKVESPTPSIQVPPITSDTDSQDKPRRKIKPLTDYEELD